MGFNLTDFADYEIKEHLIRKIDYVSQRFQASDICIIDF